MRFYWLILGVLAVWRITHLLQAEDGPADVLVSLRRLAGEGFLGKLLDCFYCLSLWIAAPLAWWLGSSWPERLLLWPALSAGAILLHRLTESPTEPAATYWEDEEEEDGMLRETETGDAVGDSETSHHSR